MVQRVNMPDVSPVGLNLKTLIKNGKIKVQILWWTIWSGNDNEMEWYNEDEKGRKITSQWTDTRLIKNMQS